MRKAVQAKERLRRAEWLVRAETQELMSVLGGRERQTKAVGGIVRDTLLDRPRENADLDFATELPPNEVMARAEINGIAVYPTGIEHGTVTLRLRSLTAEVTTLREDVETDGRHAVVRFGTDWRQDAGRRDFTLNALYADIDGYLFDPLGGLADCLAGRVRFIGSPARRISEDRLRVYRFFRFSASHGEEQLDRDGLAACAAMADQLSLLSAERVGAEMKRMLALPKVASTLKCMRDIGIFLSWSSELLARLKTYEQTARKPNVYGRLALLLTEIPAPELQAMWRLSNDDLGSAATILTSARQQVEYNLNEAAYRYPAALADGLEVAAVIANWSEAGKAAVREQLQQLQVPRFPIRGDDLINIGMTPGPKLGQVLERLERTWIESGFALDRDALLASVDRPA